MTAFIPPTAHEEIDFLEEVERALQVLTTAELEGMASAVLTPGPAVTATLKTVIPAQAGTHNPLDFPDENDVIATPRGYGSRPAPG